MRIWSRYYNQPAEKLRRYQGLLYGHRKPARLHWLQGFVEAGATHFCVRIMSVTIEANIDIGSGDAGGVAEGLTFAVC